MNELNLKIEKKIDSVEEYEFEPIKGFPMLSWQGKRPFTSTQYYPAQLKETHGQEVAGWLNKIFWGDNLQVMSNLLKEFRGQVDLIYIDPPYDSKADYKKRISLIGKQVENDRTSFEEKQYTDIWSNDEYLQFLYERFILMKELLSDQGSVFVHCDWRKSHLIRCILDEVFGNGGQDANSQGFRNEIIWRYETGGRAQKYYSKKHDSIFWYSKTSNWIFNLDDVSEERGSMKKNNMKKSQDVDGRIYYSIKSNGKEYRYYEDDLVPPSDVWDISHLQQQDPERSGYPTQKPENLINRIILGSSNPGDLIFDCFMGSGTTQAVAMKLGRRFIGADINLGAIQTTTKRLINLASDLNSKLQEETKYTGFSVYNVNHYDVFRNPLEAKDLLIKALEIQPLPHNTLYDGEKDGRMVKIMPVNRIATKADLNGLITGFDYNKFEKLNDANPNKPVELITIVCMGHEPSLGAKLEKAVHPYKIDVEVVDILRDKANLEFKRDAEAEVIIEGDKLIIREFFPMNLLQKLSLMKDNVNDWKELVESVMIDFNFDGSVFEPKTVDIPEKNELVKGIYTIPPKAGTIKVKITDLLSESFETTINNG